jgi:predicted Zn-dependent protease
MKKRVVTALALGGMFNTLAWSADAPAIQNDVQLRAMVDELARTKTLQLNNLDKPYFVQYAISDSEEILILASLGGILTSSYGHSRSPHIEVRVGSAQFDNTNSVFSGNARFGSLPIDDDYAALRTEFWLGSDAVYKSSTDQITRKRNAAREMAEVDQTPDLSPAKPLVDLEPPSHLAIDQHQWEEILRRASAKFTAAPSVSQSHVRFRTISSSYRVVNSEGTIFRIPQDLSDVTIYAEALAPDGNKVWNYRAMVGLTAASLPSGEAVEKMAERTAADLESLVKAPVSEDYSGPVLFEQEAAAQMLAATLEDAIRLQRKPVAPPNSNSSQILESVWATKVGSKVLPEWLSIIDDPLKQDFQGTELAGFYKVDDEGVAAERVVLVDKGVMKGFLASREPVKTIAASNGHGRLPGLWGTELAVPGNLFIEASEKTPEDQMKAKLIEKAKAAGLKFGLLIRRLDFPSAAGGEELQSMGRQLQKGGVSRTLNSPLFAYRVYLDGHEELVRGLRFKDFSAKDLRDIDMASDKPYVLNYVNNGSGFNHADSGQSATTSSVIAPSLLLDSVDLARAENEPGKLPLVPAPALMAQQ